MHSTQDLFSNFILRPGTSGEVVRQACSTLKLTPPDDYVNVMLFTDGGEGFVGHSYFRLYSADDLLTLNKAYQVETFTPGLVIFGTDAGGDAYAFDIRDNPLSIVRIPLIPLDFKYIKPGGNSFTGFLESLAQAGDGGAETPVINPDTVGVEIHRIKPIIFGGSPTDRENIALLPPVKHAEYCVFWNNTYRSIIEKQT